MAARRAPPSARRFVVEALEPRLLYSADLGPSLLGAALVSPVGEQRLLESEPAAAEPQAAAQQTQSREIVFIDEGAPDAEQLVADIAAQRGRDIEVVRIAPDEDGLARIGAELAERQDISAVHIISHGADATVHLGASTLDWETVQARGSELAGWSGSLTADADLLIYGCDVAESAAGRALLERLAALTGADVAASTNPTGSRALGGDWTLEYSTSAIEAHLALSQAAQDEWFGLLANSAPVLSGANDLGTILEDSATNPGTLVSDLIAGHVSDADVGASAGIAVVGVDNTNGLWQYSLDAGASWSSFGSPSAASARLLAADGSTYVRFVPNAGWNGSVANGLTFRAWDRTSGVNGGTADTSSTTLTVRDEFNTVSYANSDGTASWSTGWVDGDGNPAAGNIRVTGGELVLSTSLGSESVSRQVDLSAATGATLSFSFDNQLGLLGSVSLQASNDGGATYSTLATFSSGTGSGTYTADLGAYLAFDTRIRFVMSGTLLGGSFHVDNVEVAYSIPLSGGSTAFSAATASSGVIVAPVNDAPAGADNTVTALEDAPYVFAAADFGFSDTDGNALATVKIASLPTAGTLTNNGVAVSAGQTVSAADIASGLLRFTPAVNANGAGYASFTFQVQDDGGTANGGVDLDPTARTMTVNVTAVNDAPSGTDNTVTTVEDAPYVFNAADFGFSDTDGNALTAVKIASLPTTGTLTNNGVAVTAGQFVSAADIASGLLQFTPAAGASGAGYASFTFQVQDDGGTASGGVDLDPTARTMTLNVTGVNDAPSGTDNTVTTVEDAPYVFAAADFGFSDTDGNALAAVKIASLPTAGTLKNNGVAVSAGQAVSAADIAAGLLRFTPAPNANAAGYASFTFHVQDDGGTANGGVDFDATARTMTLNVASVNDAPSGTNSTLTVQQDGAYVFSNADFGFADSDGDAFVGVVISTVPAGGVITDNGAPVSAGQTVSAANIGAGLVRYAPAPGASGSAYANFTFRVQDSGGTANGGADTDAVARTMTIDVTPAPVAVSTTTDVPPPPSIPAPVQTGAPAPLDPAAPLPQTPALSTQSVPGAVSARLLLASADVAGTLVDVEEGFRAPVVAAPLVSDPVFASAQRLATSAPAAVAGSALPASLGATGERQLEFERFGLITVSDSTTGVGGSRAPGLANDLDRVREEMGARVHLEHWVTGSIAAGSVGLTVGYVLWLLRGGALLASLLSSLPAWRLVDPLPVLSRVDDEEDQDEDEDAFVSFEAASPPRPALPEKA